MNNFGLISRMLTDWAYPAGAIHRRLETRWVKPVRPGDTIRPTGIVKSKQVTKNSRWVLIDVMVRNQAGEKSPPARRWWSFRTSARWDKSRRNQVHCHRLVQDLILRCIPHTPEISCWFPKGR